MPKLTIEFKSLKSRIAVIFLTLILLIQAIGSIAIRLSIEKNARASVEEQLEIGQRIFLSLLEQNGESLSQGARILAADYGFRQAIGSNDHETITSALSNHQTRINADIAIFYAQAQQNLVVSGNLAHQEALNEAIDLIAKAQAGNNHDFKILNGKPYQLVAVPIKAPLTIGWVIMGFEINNSLAKKLHQLSNLDVTFISKVDTNHWYYAATTMSDASATQLVSSLSMQGLPQLAAKNQAEQSAHTASTTLSIENTEYGTRYVTILRDHQQILYAALQRSIDEATAPYKTLMINLLILTMGGAVVFALVIFYVAKKISDPITELAKNAEKLGDGHYDVAIQSNRADELGDLSRAFNNMTHAISSREEHITKLAYWDQLTTLPNRFSFMQKLTEAIEAANHNHTSVSVLVMNLDRFKKINTVLGHASGNEVLTTVAERMKNSIRRSSDVVARLSGDEFAILLPNTDSKTALIVAAELEKKLESAVQIGDQKVDVSASMGVATYPEHAENDERLLARAELAMHIAKEKQSHLVAFEPQFDASSKANLSLASDLKIAIQENHLRIFVQPKVDLHSKTVTSVEALIRWIHPERGQIFPDEFIPFAEQTGLIQKISIWMLNQAASYSAQWRQLGESITVAVNLSTRDLIDIDLPSKLQHILQTHGITASDLSLEITESSIMDDPQRALETLNQLSDMGFKLSIDDFGTGYSSLAYLKKLPLNELKIDKSFVLHMAEDNSDVTIVKSTIDLGHNLNLKVVAEGIENQEAWQLLAKMGCDYGQGYYMSRPMPAQDFYEWLHQWKSKH